MRNRWWVGPGVAAAVALLAACGSSASSGSAASGSGSGSSAGGSGAAPAKPSTSAAGLLTASPAGGGTVITTAQGFTVYYFAIDKPNKSNCDSTCLSFWPPLTGTPSAGSGASLPGKFGTIKGTGGITQATYDGHPLYLFTEDTKPGMISGNGMNQDGGLWWAITPSGTKLAAASTSSGGGAGGGTGGYGY